MKLHQLTAILIILSLGCRKDQSINDNPSLTAPISEIDSWGDSLTAGDGGKGETYPGDLAKLTGLRVENYGKSGETSTQIRDRLLANDRTRLHLVIIWAGRNNYNKKKTVISDIDQMIKYLDSDHYLVLGLINSNNKDDHKGGFGYKAILEINQQLKNRYQSRFLDIRQDLVAAYQPDNAADKTNHDDDVPPASKRSDPLHLNASGYKLVADKIYNRLQELSFLK